MKDKNNLKLSDPENNINTLCVLLDKLKIPKADIIRAFIHVSKTRYNVSLRIKEEMDGDNEKWDEMDTR